MLRLDGPWCSITTSHASSAFLPEKDSPLLLPKVSKAQQWKEGMAVKGRMEPAEVRFTLEES
jgi:TatD DNase family protein